LPFILLAFAYNDFNIIPSENPYIKGIIVPINPEKYYHFEIIQTSATASYSVMNYFNNDRTKTYESNRNPQENKGVEPYSGLYLFPLKHLFNSLGLNLNIEIDHQDKMAIFSFNS